MFIRCEKSDVLYEVEKSELTKFADFARSRGRSEGYVIVIMTFFKYIEWYDPFFWAGMDIIPHP